MKQLFLICFAVTTVGAKAQIINVKKTVKQKSENRVNNKAGEGVDKGLNKVEEGIGDLFKKKKKKNDDAETNENESSNNNSGAKSTTSAGGNSSLKSYSKFDFVPGEKILYYDDFERGETGDFPTGWNTNSSAEIVTFNDIPGKWLSITKDGFFQPEMVKDLPENFTLEFDVINRYRSNNILYYNFNIYQTANARKDIDNAYLDNTFQLRWDGCSGNVKYNIQEKREEVSSNNNIKTNQITCTGTDFSSPAKFRFSLWRQKNRLRVYINEEKIIDIPQAFNSSIKYNAFKLGAQYMNFSNGREHDDEFMVSNFRYAIGAADTRSKLMSTGKFSTTGILFDVNSDKIKAGSYGTLKEIATVLKENPTIQVKIIGHTDSDGNAAANVSLSQKRAAAVKETLSKEFDIDGSRLQTDGKGAAEPVADNTSAQGKANNRRVEFIKL